MMRNTLRTIALGLILGLAGLGVQAQQSAIPYAKLVLGDATTVQSKLAKISAGAESLMLTTDTNGYSGVCVNGCGVAGTQSIAFAGIVPLIMDASATAGHYVQISVTTNGDGRDTGATTFPTSGGSVIGRVVVGCSGAQCKATIDLFPAEASTPSAAGSRRSCDITVGDTSASAAITNAQLGPQKRICYIPMAATILEMDVAADAGTPNVIVARNTAGTPVNIVSAALATAASGGIACSNTGGTTGLDGATTCSATLQNTSVAQGAYIELVSGTAGGTAKLMSIHIIYLPN